MGVNDLGRTLQLALKIREANSLIMAGDLSDDIQRALQHAIVDASDVVPPTRQRKKKQARDAEGDWTQGELLKPKKKRKTRAGEDAEKEAQPNASDEPDGAPESGSLAREAKTKKKRKDKGKQRAVEVSATQVEPQQVPPVLDEDLAAASADFLSAVVAAASATSHIQDPNPPEFPTPASPFPPYAEHVVQYPPSDFAFPPPPPPSFGLQGMFPDLHGLLPDLNLASGDELLRTLQDMDFAKLASVLKALGDAGLPNLSGQTPSMLPAPFPSTSNPPGPPPVNQVSAKSVAILGRDPKQVKESGQSTRELPPPAALPFPRPSEEGNPDHAHMLANVWMNAGKLADMVKTQGASFWLLW